MDLQLNTDISLSLRPLPTRSHLSRPHFNECTFSLYPVHRRSINRGIFIDHWRVGELGWVNGKIDAFLALRARPLHREKIVCAKAVSLVDLIFVLF